MPQTIVATITLLELASILTAADQSAEAEQIISFCPERALFRSGGVNLRPCLCGVPVYASAQSLDFLARTKKPSSPNQKPTSGVSGRKLINSIESLS